MKKIDILYQSDISLCQIPEMPVGTVFETKGPDNRSIRLKIKKGDSLHSCSLCYFNFCSCCYKNFCDISKRKDKTDVYYSLQEQQ